MSIDITQDYEFFDGEIGGRMATFWAPGHGHDTDAFIRGVLNLCLDEGADVPAITQDDTPVEMWQRNVESHDGVYYDRATEIPTHGRKPDWFPVTVLDVEPPRRGGGTKCGVDKCVQPWRSGEPIRVCIEPTDDPDPGRYMTVRVWLCREHAHRFPDPTYRVFMVPAGATVLLPSAQNAAAST